MKTKLLLLSLALFLSGCEQEQKTPLNELIKIRQSIGSNFSVYYAKHVDVSYGHANFTDEKTGKYMVLMGTVSIEYP